MSAPPRLLSSSRSSGEYAYLQIPSLMNVSGEAESGSSDTSDTLKTPGGLSSPLSPLPNWRDYIGAPDPSSEGHPGVDGTPSSTVIAGSSLTEHPRSIGDRDSHEGSWASPALHAPPLLSSPPVRAPYRAGRSATSPTLHMSLNVQLAKIFTTPNILCVVLAGLLWEEFMAFVNASSAVRRFFDFQDLEIREVVVDRFVSGYVNGQRCEEGDISVSLEDLEALMASQSRSLSTYPTQAIVSLSMSPDGMDNHARMLARLASAHSRFVLLLHKRARSVGDSFHWRGMRRIHNIAMTDDPDIDSLPELRIPAPLSYFPQSSDRTRTEPSHNVSTTPLKEKVRRVTLLKRFRGPPPPPPSPMSVHVMRYRSYHGGLRYNLGSEHDPFLSHLNPSTTISTRNAVSRSISPRSPDSPVSRTPSESSTSLSSSPTSSSSFFIPPNPHALLTATSRYFAPVVRVFVPCEELSPSAVKACQGQLVRAGLWDHIMIGDIVINLGYVPIFEDAEPKWLIYDGVGLTPFNPYRSPPLIANSLHALLCPTYYAHLSHGADPLHCIRIPPHIGAEVEMTLVQLPSTVLNTRGMGDMRVTRYAWTARFSVLEVGLWSGEWVLEGEATPEGERMLQRALQGRGMFLWRVVLDRCLNGMVWLQLVRAIGIKVES